MFSFLRDWRRRRILRKKAIDEAVFQEALGLVPLLEDLEPDELGRLRDLATLFLAATSFEGVRDFEVTDVMRVVVALQACLPVLELGLGAYHRVRTVLLYPDRYRSTIKRVNEDGTVEEDGSWRAGEAWDFGAIVLSWEDVLEGARDPEDGYNVVLHEFAHQLDKLDDAYDGRPPVLPGMDAEAWERDFAAELEALQEAVSKRRRRRKAEPLIDPYGAESPEEFFAVLTETFFEMPIDLRQEHPKLYEHLRTFFRQDPAARLERHVERRKKRPEI
jgi:hypothetical protein